MLKEQKIKAVFFDQDRTLLTVQSNNIYQKLIDLAAELFSLGKEALFIEVEKRLESGRKSSEPSKSRFGPILKQIIVEVHGKLDQEKWATIEKEYYSLIRNSVEVNLGVLEFLELVKELNLLLFVFTEDDRKGIEAKLKYLNLAKIFDSILTLDEVGKMKPNIAYYAQTLAEYNLDWKDCIFVGDKWDKDCSIPHQHDATTVLFGAEDERADYCINDMRDLLTIIEKENVKSVA